MESHFDAMFNSILLLQLC